jgi:protein subunit release factor B
MRERILHLTKRDFVRQTFHAGGKGGQNVNKVETGVRFIHEPSRSRGQSTEERSQTQNEQIAFRRMAESPKMRAWIAEQHSNYVRQQTIEEKVKEMMTAENLRLEVKDENGRWVEEELL